MLAVYEFWRAELHHQQLRHRPQFCPTVASFCAAAGPLACWPRPTLLLAIHDGWHQLCRDSGKRQSRLCRASRATLVVETRARETWSSCQRHQRTDEHRKLIRSPTNGLKESFSRSGVKSQEPHRLMAFAARKKSGSSCIEGTSMFCPGPTTGDSFRLRSKREIGRRVRRDFRPGTSSYCFTGIRVPGSRQRPTQDDHINLPHSFTTSERWRTQGCSLHLLPWEKRRKREKERKNEEDIGVGSDIC